jgi:hypothetical protein
MDDERWSLIQAELTAIRKTTDRLSSVLEEFLPMARKAAAIKAMNPATKVREAINRGKSRSLTPGSDGSGEAG